MRGCDKSVDWALVTNLRLFAFLRCVSIYSQEEAAFNSVREQRPVDQSSSDVHSLTEIGADASYPKTLLYIRELSVDNLFMFIALQGVMISEPGWKHVSAGRGNWSENGSQRGWNPWARRSAASKESGKLCDRYCAARIALGQGCPPAPDGAKRDPQDSGPEVVGWQLKERRRTRRHRGGSRQWVRECFELRPIRRAVHWRD